MPSPLTHLAFAAAHWPDPSPEILAGAVFPDIRYLGTTKREVTHREVKPTDDFLVGISSHLRLDAAGDAVLRANGFFERWDGRLYHVSALKLLTDETAYALTDRWPKIIGGLESAEIDASILASYGVTAQDLTRWHRLLVGYCRERPSPASRLELYHDRNIDPADIEAAINDLKADARTPKLVDDYLAALALALAE